MNDSPVDAQDLEELYQKLNEEALSGGYHLNPDVQFAKDLVEGLITNEKRYGYRACPCRLAAGTKEKDLDIICPCDYRDADLAEHGMCYCALYVTREVVKGEKKLTGSIPERRPPIEERTKGKGKVRSRDLDRLPLPVWRCKVCGYLCAREGPPEECPVCKALKERFERFL
jgi:ferredoxin-thioredoxin reductase catalytic subunit